MQTLESRTLLSVTPTGVTFAPTEASAFTGTVATFTANDAGLFTASINWGDGTTTAGTITGGSGNFTVGGTHTYAEDGGTAVSVAIIDSADASTATATSTANIAEAGLTATPAAATFTVTEGVAASGNVANLSDPGSTDPATSYTATINWGDGTSSTGTVGFAAAGSYFVSGNHTYADEGTFTISVSATETAATPAATTTTSAIAKVIESDTLTPAASASGSGSENDPSFQVNIPFTNSNAGAVASDFTGTIDWGDGTVTAGTVSGSGTSLTVHGTHLYADEGVFPLTVTLADDAPGTATATFTGTATVTEADIPTPTTAQPTVTAIENSSFSGNVATLSNSAYPNNPGSDFTATINWGDGTTDTGVPVTGGSGANLTVAGTHTYTEDGSYPITTTISDNAPGTATATATNTATVHEQTSGITDATITTTEGQSFTGTLATASDPGSPDPAGAFTAMIDWGDGTTATGTVSGSAGSYTISGSHIYADEGTQSATVTFFEKNEPTFSVSVSNPVTIGEADVVTAPPSVSGSGPENDPTFAVTVPFTNSNASAVASDFTGTIDWGDGTVTAGTVSGGGTSLTVHGTHLYADEGVFPIHVTLADDAPGTATATFTATGTVTEIDTPTPTTAQPTVTAIEQLSFTGNVATFSNSAYPNNPGSDFTATINWGDGTTDTGVPATGGSGANLTVAGTHTYSEDGSYTITTTISDDAPGTATATATNTATVNEQSLGITGVPVFTTEGQSFSGALLATASDPGSTNAASDFTAAIDWGDGTTTTGTVSGSAGSYTISGSHIYSDEGTPSATVTFFEKNDPTFSVSTSDAVTIDEADTLTPGFITTGTVTEDTLVGGTAAVFHDAGYPGNPASDFTGTFDWGDGTTFTSGAGNVTITSDGAGNITLSVAGHSYADEGVHSVIATLADNAPGTASLSQTGTLTVIEGDAFTPSPTPVTIAATEGATASGTVAIFSNTGYPTNSAADFTATVNWGDGTTTTGTVSAAGGNFTISGSHAYADDGAFTITATLIDDAPGSVTASASATANISEAGLTATPAAATFSVSEGVANSGVVATLSDPGSTDPASDYTATIDWGDGTISAGTISGAMGSYSVSGAHTYVDEGSFTISVAETETAAPPTATATTSAPVVVSESDVLTGSASAHATEGTAFTGAVATFTNTGFAGNVVGDFTAVIDWGDGTTTTGTVSGSAGTFTVSGGHTYADEGSSPLTVTLTDNAPGTATATATGTATIADNDTLVAGAAATLSGTEATTVSGVLATFTDTTYAANLPTDFSASIDWGDGSTTSGTVGGSAGSFTVTGSHVYAEEGTKTATVVLSDDAPGTAAGTATATIHVADAALSATGATVAPTEGLSFSGILANFTDADPNGTATDYSASIIWGDGSTSTGTIGANGSGGFQVTGTHTYAEEGTNAVTVTIADVGGSTAIASSTADVGDAPLSAVALTVTPTEGAAFTGVVATITDANPNGTSSDFTATIDWGDGSTTSATIAANGSGAFNVTGTHTYLEEGTNSVHVVVHDVGGSTASAVSTAQVADATLSATAVPVSSPEFTPFSGVVATFTDADPNGTVTDYTATIDWGDGSTATAGTVAAVSGGFNVTGSHTYAEDGTHNVVVTIVDTGGSTASATGTATISEPSLSVSPTTITGHERSTLSGVTVATFLHGNGAEPASGFTANIDWGDGTSSSGTVSESGTSYTVVASHTYFDEQTFPVSVQIQDDTASALVASSAHISQELLPNGTVGTANERFVAEVYRDLFHRQIDPTALPYWSNMLDQGQTRLQVVQKIINAAMPDELSNDLVQGMYQKYLGRAPDADGLAYWQGKLNQDETIEQVEAEFIATPEFFTLSASTNNGYVNRLYELVLGRPAEPTGHSHFSAALTGGASREQVADAVFGSNEYHQKFVGDSYQTEADGNDRFAGTTPYLDDLDFLDRHSDPSGLAAFTGAMDHGLTDQQVWAAFMASEEYFAKTA